LIVETQMPTSIDRTRAMTRRSIVLLTSGKNRQKTVWRRFC